MQNELKYPLKQYLSESNLLNDKEIDLTLSMFRTVRLKKDEYFITDDKICNKVGFIVQGGIRGFIMDFDGEENNICFKFENQFITSYESFTLEQISKKNIQAIEDCIFLVIQRNELDTLFQEVPACNFILKLLVDQELIDKENYLINFNCKSAKEKYLQFLDQSPEIVRRVKVSHLASYLGMTPRTLTRVKKQITVRSF